MVFAIWHCHLVVTLALMGQTTHRHGGSGPFYEDICGECANVTLIRNGTTPAKGGLVLSRRLPPTEVLPARAPLPTSPQKGFEISLVGTRLVTTTD